MPVSVHELTEYISWASDDYLHLALSDGTDGKITKANIVSGLTGAGALDVYYVKRSNNLSDIANPALARANLNLGSVALLNQITKANIVDFSEADYATAAQGLLAEAALQAGDNISELVNDAGYIPSSQKGVANGIASLDINGKIPELQIPAIAISNTFVVESEVEQLALDAQVGDVAIRNDESRSYILQGTDPSDLADWQELKTPTGGVGSVNGQTGTVVLNADDIGDDSTINKFVTGAQLTKIDSVETGAQVNTVNSVAGKTGSVTLVKADVGLSNVDNTNDLSKPISTVTQTALNSKANSSVNLTAGTGLTGGGNLTADRTFAVTYGTTAGTSAQGDDTRLSDAREWTATTVPQVEAEAGTATTRRAWTAQRVFQAIAAWWNASSAKTKLDGIATGAEVNQNAFSTISVAGQSDVTADSKTDVVTFVGGTGVNISTDPVTDTITFEATGVGTGSIEEVIAGSGLVGGGTASTVTLNVGAGTGITVTTDTVGLDTANARNVDHSAVSITAGTGLTGGGNLTATRTLNVSYGTTAGTAAQGNDSRLSDSREWTAATVDQTEAETGTANTRRAWTAQRVRQAIVAWWNTTGTTVGKALLNLTNPAATRFLRINADNTVTARSDSEMRTDLGLGTAATANVTTSALDDTAGRVLTVGYHGLGAVDYNNDTLVTDLTNPPVSSGFYFVGSGATGNFTGTTCSLLVKTSIGLRCNYVLTSDTGITWTSSRNQLGELGGWDRTITDNSPRALLLPGPVSSPTYSYSGDEDTGVTRLGANILGLITGAVERVSISLDGLNTSVPISFTGGSAGTNAVTTRTNLGLGTVATQTVVTGNGDTTTSRIPTVGWVQANVNNYTLPAATATILGGIELFSNTVQPVTGNAVSATAARTYGIQINSAGQAVVNVPWTDSDTTYSGSTSVVLSGNSFQRAALTGDVTASANSNATTISSNAVSNTKLSDMATSTIKGRATAGTGDPEDLTAAQVRTLLNVSNGATANQTDAYLLSRTNHTGTQAHTTITGLGTAATATLTTSTSDTTAGRVLKVGDFNIGTEAGWETGVDLDTKVTPGHYFIAVDDQTNGPESNTLAGVLEVLLVNLGGVTRVLQKFHAFNTDQMGRVFIRFRNNATTWQPWREQYSSNPYSIVPVENGGTNANNVAGARTNLGLGTAATQTVVTGTGDTTSTRIPTVGWVQANAGAGSVTEVVAGNGLTGGGTSSTVTLDVGAGDGISVAANTVAVNSTVVRTTGTQSIGGAKTFTSEVTAPSFNTSSSLKYKTDIGEFENALEKLMAIDVITYKRKIQEGEPQDDKVYLGVSAESLAKVVPELVRFKDGEPDSVNYAQGFALCVQAIQELVKERKI